MKNTSIFLKELESKQTTNRNPLMIAASVENDSTFFKWLAGFVDGEGNFSVSQVNNGKNFRFSFSIGLHVDDLSVLEFISNKLNMGNINHTSNSARLVISKAEDLHKLINIFDRSPSASAASPPLKMSPSASAASPKYLDYLDFKKAFLLYVETKDKSLQLIEELISIKNNMNSYRSNFDMSSIYTKNNIDISGPWLLGFIEGEGSFYVLRRNPSNLSPVFSISQLSRNWLLMESIQEFLNSLAINSISSWRESQNGVFTHLHTEVKTEKEDMLMIHVTRTEYLIHVLIPFLASLNWHSKKYLDFQDWESIIRIKAKGLHYLPEGAKIIDLLLSQMNNNRLSTSLIKSEKSNTTPILSRDLLLESVEDLRRRRKPSNYEKQEDGRILIKSENRYYSDKNNIQVIVENLKGETLHRFNSIIECLDTLKITKVKYYNSLNKNTPLVINGEQIIIKRIINSKNSSIVILESSTGLGLLPLALSLILAPPLSAKAADINLTSQPFLNKINTIIDLGVNSSLEWLSMGTIWPLFFLLR